MVGKAERLIKILNPIGVQKLAEIPLAPRVDDLNGKLVAFVSNGWPAFEIVLNRWEELLRSRYELRGPVMRFHEKGPGGISALAHRGTRRVLAEEVDDLAARCDVAVNGLGA